VKPVEIGEARGLQSLARRTEDDGMNRIAVGSDSFVCELWADAQPAVEVPPGSTLVVRCRNALDCAVGTGPVRAGGANPATGPIAVTGARPGQALRLTILDIACESVGYVASEASGRFRRLEIEDGEVAFDGVARIPLDPMIGVLGVAPARGSWKTMACGPFGGNMDVRDVAPGATVFLPVFQPGGLFVSGDLHAVMGDGEIGGQGLEVAGEITLTVDLEPRPLSPAPYLVRNHELMTIGTARSLGEACEQATRAMVALLERADIMDSFTALKFLGLAGDIRVGQQCCPTKSARVAVPLRYLPALRSL